MGISSIDLENIHIFSVKIAHTHTLHEGKYIKENCKSIKLSVYLRGEGSEFVEKEGIV